MTSVAKESCADSVHQWWFSPSGHLDRRKGCSLKRSIWQSAVVQTHKSGTLSDFTKLNLTSVSDSYHCLVVQVLLKCSTYNLQFEVAGILYGVLLDPSLPPWLSSLLKRADWSPQKSRLVSSNSSLATRARLHTATSRPSRLEQTNRLTTNPPTEPTHYSDTAEQWHHDTLFASH